MKKYLLAYTFNGEDRFHEEQLTKAELDAKVKELRRNKLCTAIEAFELHKLEAYSYVRPEPEPTEAE